MYYLTTHQVVNCTGAASPPSPLSIKNGEGEEGKVSPLREGVFIRKDEKLKRRPIAN
jgi:hypothetical protein